MATTRAPVVLSSALQLIPVMVTGERDAVATQPLSVAETIEIDLRRPFFAMANMAENARRKAQGKTPGAISPLALEAVRRINASCRDDDAVHGGGALSAAIGARE